MINKFLATIFIGTTLLILSSCGNNQATTSTEVNKEVTEGSSTIKIWGMGAEGNLLPDITGDFENQNSGLKVEVQALPWDQAHDKLLTAVASKTGPDIIQMGTTWIPEFADADALTDLSPYIETYTNLKKENYFDGSLETTTYNNKYVGIPWYVDTRVLFYRTDLLSEVGYPNGPNTWDELKDASTKLAARGDNMYGIELDPKDQIFTIIYGWQNGSEIIKDGEPLLNQPEFVESIEFTNSFFQEGLAQKQGDMDITQAFKEGIKPMFISGPWMVNTLKNQATEIDGKWAVRTLPSKKTNTSSVGGSNLTIFSSSNNIDNALKFISYLTDVDTQMKWFDISNSLPSRKEAWENEKLKSDSILSVFGEQMKNAKSAPFITQWEPIAQELISAFERINLGGSDIQTELDAVNEKAKELLAD